MRRQPTKPLSAEEFRASTMAMAGHRRRVWLFALALSALLLAAFYVFELEATHLVRYVPCFFLNVPKQKGFANPN